METANARPSLADALRAPHQVPFRGKLHSQPCQQCHQCQQSQLAQTERSGLWWVHSQQCQQCRQSQLPQTERSGLWWVQLHSQQSHLAQTEPYGRWWVPRVVPRVGLRRVAMARCASRETFAFAHSRRPHPSWEPSQSALFHAHESMLPQKRVAGRRGHHWRKWLHRPQLPPPVGYHQHQQPQSPQLVGQDRQEQRQCLKPLIYSLAAAPHMTCGHGEPAAADVAAVGDIGSDAGGLDVQWGGQEMESESAAGPAVAIPGPTRAACRVTLARMMPQLPQYEHGPERNDHQRRARTELARHVPAPPAHQTRRPSMLGPPCNRHMHQHE
jgi:hypothetical protein